MLLGFFCLLCEATREKRVTVLICVVQYSIWVALLHLIQEMETLWRAISIYMYVYVEYVDGKFLCCFDSLF